MVTTEPRIHTDEMLICSHAKIIEKKLDDIAMLLDRYRERPAPAERSTEHSSLSKEGNSTTPATTQAPDQEFSSIPLIQSVQASFPPRSGSIPVVPGFEIPFVEADQVLQEYMTVMLPQFPFVPLPCHNAYDMFKDKPLLLKTILWVCRPPKPEASAAFESRLRQHIAHQTVVLGNKSLELVQTILVFLAW